MATRTEGVLGVVTGVGTTYTIVGSAVAASTTWNLQIHLTNRAAVAIHARVYRADTSWSSGEPTGGTLKTALLYDGVIQIGGRIDLAGQVFLTTDKLVVRSDVATSLDVQADGIAIT